MNVANNPSTYHGLEGHGPPTFYRPSEAPDVVDYMRTISTSFGTQFATQEDCVSVVL